MPAKLIGTILEEAAEVRSLTSQSHRLIRLQRLLRSSLPAGIADQISVGAFAHGRLTVATANGAAAAKFRQLSPRLIKELRHEEPELNAFKVTVQVPVRDKALQKKQFFLDHTARTALLTLAANITDSSLRSALLRLAGRVNSLKNKQEPLEDVDSYKNQDDNNQDL